MKKNSAMAVMIGALVLAAIITAGFALVVVILTSQPPPMEYSAGDFQLKIDPVQPGAKVHISLVRGDKYRVYNEGTTDINPSFRILVDGRRWPVEDSGEKETFKLYKSVGGTEYSGYLAPGDTLTGEYKSGERPDSVSFIEKKPDGSEFLLWSYGKSDFVGGADFYGTPRDVCVGDLVRFYDASTNNPTKWSWNFGDGSPIFEGEDPGIYQNPSHEYTNVGTYTVSFTASNYVGSDIETKTGYIRVKRVIASFTANKYTVVSGDSVTFTDLSRCNPETWKWTYFPEGQEEFEKDFPDDVKNLPNPICPFNEVGKFTVRLTVTNSGSTDSFEKTINVIPSCTPPTGNFIPNPPSGFATPLDVTFTDASTGDITGWSWDFGDGRTATGQGPHTHTYETTGHHYATLTVTGCEQSDVETKDIEIDCTPPTALFTRNPESGEVPHEVTFTDTSTGSITSWSWNFGDGGTATGKGPHTHRYETTGTHHATLTVSGPCGEPSTASLDVVAICNIPDASFTYSPNFDIVPLSITFTDTSTGSITSWSWEFGDGGTATGKGPHTHTYTTGGTYSITLKVSGLCGMDTHTEVISCKIPKADFDIISEDKVEYIDVLDKSSGNINSWFWVFQDGTPETYSFQNPPRIFYSGTKHVIVTQTVSGPCGDDSYYEYASAARHLIL